MSGPAARKGEGRTYTSLRDVRAGSSIESGTECCMSGFVLRSRSEKTEKEFRWRSITSARRSSRGRRGNR